MLSLYSKFRAVVSSVGSFGKGCVMTISGNSKEKTPRDGVRVRTSVPDGRKYVKSDELIRSNKAKRQMGKLRKIIERDS